MDTDSVIAKICISGSSFKATRPNELSFEQGDLLTLASELSEDGEHYQAVVSDGSMGLIQRSSLMERNAIPMFPMAWFHAAISRLDAEKLLDQNYEGQFLLRTSQSNKAVYALAISHGGKVNHYLIAMDSTSKNLTLNGDKYFAHLPALVQAHMENAGSLACCLSHPLTRRGVLDFHIDKESLKTVWGLPKAEVELGDSLGRGEFGEVRTAIYRGVQVAAKVIHEDKLSTQNTDNFLQEAAILTHFQHQNLVQLVGVVFQGPVMKCILTELMGKGSLQKYLISRGRSVVTQQELLSFARAVCGGMVYISSQGFVHRDLAARNVLLNSNGQAKISDFGLARKAELYVPHEGGKFPVKWTAPEALKESKFSVKSDVWSYGVLLWEIYSYGRTPYPSVPTSEVLENIEDGVIMDPPDYCPDEIYDLMCTCWEIEPNQRPSFHSLQLQLARASFDRSCTPNNSPMVARKPFPAPNVDQLVNGPIAIKAYREAPISRKLAIFLGNIILLGDQGSGKTSLLRSLTGEAFRLVEPPSQIIDISKNYCLLTDNLSWNHSIAGLVYEDELVRVIVEDLLKHVSSSLSKSSLGVADMNGLHQPPVVGGAEAPSLPPPRRRSQSFSETRGCLLDGKTKNEQFSGGFEIVESSTGDGTFQLRSRTKQQKGAKRRFAKFLNRNFGHHQHQNNTKEHRKVQRHFSDSAKHLYNVTPLGDSSPILHPNFSPLPERLTERIKEEFSECSGGTLPPRYLARLIDTPGHPSFRVLQSLFLTENSLCLLVFDASKDILASPASSLTLKRNPSPEVKVNGTAPPHVPPHAPPSAPAESSHLLNIMAEVSSLCVQWQGCNLDMTICGPRIVLVGTHSDKVPSSVTHRNFEILRDEVRASPYQKYVAMVKFVVSNSSIIERSSMDDLKRFMKENVKKSCRQQVPLKWLRCMRRFQSFCTKRNYFVSMMEARKIVSEICDISSSDPEIDAVIHFLHQNQVIMHFSHVHHLRDLVITSCQWFIQQVSAVFGAAFVSLSDELSTPSDLSVDQALLRSKGVLSTKLLDFVWKEKDSQVNKDRLLAVMNKMDLLCCLSSSDTHPVPLSASVEDLTAEFSKNHRRPSVVLSSLVIPALVQAPAPPSLTTLPAYDVDTMIFRFKEHVPNGLFSRLLVRCVQSYPKGFSLYRHCATFHVDDKSLLLLTESRNHIRLSLHPTSTPNTSTGSPSQCLGSPNHHLESPNHHLESPSQHLGSPSQRLGSPSQRLGSPSQRLGSPSQHLGSPSQHLGVTDLDSVMSDSPTAVNPYTCMAVLMFVQASISNLTQQWTPHLDFDLCVKCSCKVQPIPMDAVVDIDAAMSQVVRSRLAQNVNEHYVILNDVDSLVQQLSLHCETGNQVTAGASLLCWFGEVPPPPSISPSSPLGDIDYVTKEDIHLVVKVLGNSWEELGKTLGFSRLELERFSLTSHSTSCAGKKMLEEWQTLHSKSATFYALLGSLEIIQRRDIADDLVATRMIGDGLDL